MNNALMLFGGIMMVLGGVVVAWVWRVHDKAYDRGFRDGQRQAEARRDAYDEGFHAGNTCGFPSVDLRRPAINE